MSPRAAMENVFEIIDTNLSESKVYDELFGGDGCAKIVENNGFLTYMFSSLAALAAQHIEFAGILLKFC